MHIAIRLNGLHPNVDTSDLIRTIRNSIEPLTYRVKQIGIYIEDINGPRGGVDKQCRCVLQLRGLPPVVIRDRDVNLHALVHRVAARAAEALRRKKDRIKTGRLPSTTQWIS